MIGDKPKNITSVPSTKEARDSAAAKIPDFIIEIVDKQKLAKSETPRANVIIAASYVEDLLTKLLKKVLIKSAQPQDLLFDSSQPVYNFGAKIELAYRMGRVSDDFAWVLHRIRKLRDDCAHSHEAKDFSNGKMKDLIDVTYAKLNPEVEADDPPTVDKLQSIFTSINIHLWAKINHAKELPRPGKEFK